MAQQRENTECEGHFGKKKGGNIMREIKYGHSSGKKTVSGGFKTANMNKFIFAGSKKRRKKVKR